MALAARLVEKGKEVKMALKDLIPWNRGQDVTIRRAEAPSPFLSLHREMNRLFDEAFRVRSLRCVA